MIEIAYAIHGSKMAKDSKELAIREKRAIPAGVALFLPHDYKTLYYIK